MVCELYLNKANISKKLPWLVQNKQKTPLNTTKYLMKDRHFIFILFILLFKKINLFILFLFGCVGSSLLHAGFLQLWRAGVTLRWGAQVSHCGGFSCCRAGAPRHAGSSRTRARTRVPCIDRRILNHCATREVPTFYFQNQMMSNAGYSPCLPLGSFRSCRTCFWCTTVLHCTHPMA